MTKNLVKVALIGALLVSTLVAASAQSFNGSQSNHPANSQEILKDRAVDDGNGGGGA